MRAFLPLALILCLLPSGAGARADDGTPPAPAKPEPRPATSGDPPAGLPEALLLRDAVAKGLVAASGVHPGSYESVTLVLENRSADSLALDLAGSHLRNRTGNRCQRLGLGPVATLAAAVRADGHGRLLVDLPAGKKLTLRLQTVCLDLGRPPPGNQEFEVPAEALPPVREKVLRWWMDHPDAPQSSVNEAIWQDRDTVRVPTPTVDTGTVRQVPHPKGTYGALHGGTAYRLHDGVLLSYDPDGIARLLGTEIWQVLPTADGVYAVARGPEGEAELWRFALTGDHPWGRVAALPGTIRIREVLPAGKDRLVLVTDGGITALDTGTGKLRPFLGRRDVLDVSAVRAGEDGMRVVFRVAGNPADPLDPAAKEKVQDVCEIWKVDLRLGAGTEECLKRYWSTESVVAGGAGVFGLTPAGRIRMLVGDDFHTFPESATYARLLAVGPDVLWLADSAGRVASARSKNGMRVHGTTLGFDEATAVGIDPATGDLSLTKGDRVLRIRAKEGTVEEIGAVAASPPTAGDR